MTDRPALDRHALAVALCQAIPNTRVIEPSERIVIAERVLAEHETAQQFEHHKVVQLADELVRQRDAAEARCAQVEQERKGYESEADRLTTQYVDLQAEHERLRAALERWSQDIVSGLAENTSREYCIGMLTSLRCEFDNIVNRQGPWFWK